ncbi:hypothetical protein M9458_002559, partial [Cirrhinus mrigala]
HNAYLLPANTAELGSSPPLQGSLEQLVWSVPAGAPLQGTELAVQTNPEAGLERLVPLVDYLAAWKLLPNVSAWVLRTVERGYRIQFGAPPSPFSGVFPTLGYSGDRSVMRLKFRMLTVSQVVSQIRSEDWFVTTDLKDTYFHVSILPRHRKFLRFAFRGEAYQYRVLPFGLALSPRTFTKCVDAALAPLRLRGIRILNYICVQHDTFWPAVHETPTVVAQDQGVLPEGKPVSHDQDVEEALVPVSGPGVGSSLSPHNASDGR